MLSNTTKTFALPAAAAALVIAVLVIVALNDGERDSDNEREVARFPTLRGKVIAGYYGWHPCRSDDPQKGCSHGFIGEPSSDGRQTPTISVYPELSNFPPAERRTVSISKPDGSPLAVHSALRDETVTRHFKWMKDYNIDGALLIRFASDLNASTAKQHSNKVLRNVRRASRRQDRAYALMYELKGANGASVEAIRDDWETLSGLLEITQDQGYLHHEGKPLVALSGLIPKTEAVPLEQSVALADFFLEKGCSLMIRTPADWLTLVEDPGYASLLQKADVISPANRGAYQTLREAKRYSHDQWDPEKRWCVERDIDYLPAIFPGYKAPDTDATTIPRDHGKLLWAQLGSAQRISTRMLYINSFDGLHDGTAVLKFDKDAHTIEELPTIAYENIPADYYLSLIDDGTRWLRQLQENQSKQYSESER